MKKLILLLIPIISFAQQPKDYQIINDTLWGIMGNGSKVYKGSFSGGIKLDQNKNYVHQGSRPGFVTGNSFDNFILGNNTEIHDASGVAALATDTKHLIGSDYSESSGDAHTISGYGSTTAGVFIRNHIYAGVGIGSNITLGTLANSNKLYRSVGIGSLLDINETDVYLFGTGAGRSWTQKGSFLINGNYNMGILPDGRIMINGVVYNSPNDFCGCNQTVTAKTLKTKHPVFAIDGRLIGFTYLNQ